MIYLELFLTFLKVGAFTFGGGYAMLPLIQSEVAAHGWLDEKALVDFIAVSESTPGPFAVNVSTYVGAEVGGVLLVAKCFEKFRESAIVKGCMSGLKPAVVGLIGAAVISVGKTVFMPDGASLAVFADTSFYVSLVIFAISVVLAFKKLHPIIIICASALLGIAAGYLSI